MKTTIAGLACVLLLAAATAAAQDKTAKKIYCWEEGGHKVCGDALPADATDAARTEISARTGIAVRSLDRAPTDEERAAAAVARKQAAREVQASVERLFTYAAYADKYDGSVHPTPMRNVTLAMNEPWEVMAVVCPDEAPLLAFVSLVAPALAMGNRVVAVPSARWPLAATDLYQVLETSDLPAGAVNIVTGVRDELAEVLAKHDAVQAMWYFGSAEGSAMVERESVGNLKATWVNAGKRRDWYDPVQGEGREFLRHATRVKNVWVPYGE